MNGWLVHDWSIRPDRLVFFAEFGPVSPHRHPILQITIATHGTFTVGDGLDRELRCRAAVIPSGARHVAISDPGTRVVSVHLVPGSPLARIIADRHHLDDDPASWVAAAAGLNALVHEGDSLNAMADAVIRALRGPADPGDTTHPQLRAALDRLAISLPARVQLPEVAGAVFLSPGRLGKLFSKQTGGTFPAVVRWARLLYWALHVYRGRTLTDGAHAAGFTDLAHANRVCREMTGVGPSVLLAAADGIFADARSAEAAALAAIGRDSAAGAVTINQLNPVESLAQFARFGVPEPDSVADAQLGRTG